MNTHKNQKTRRQRGTVMVEYGLLLAGILVVGAAAVSILGHKTSDLIGTAAAILPGAHADDNGPLISGKIIETEDSGGAIKLDVETIAEGGDRLADNLGISGNDLELLILEVGED